MQKAAEELKKQQEREMAEKKKAIEERVPKLDIDGLDKRMLIMCWYCYSIACESLMRCSIRHDRI